MYGIEWYHAGMSGIVKITRIGEYDMHRIAARSPVSSASKVVRRTLLSMFRRERAFLPAALRTISSAGDCYAPARPLRYPRDAGHRDLIRIGKDMYEAMGRYAVEKNGA